MVDVFVKILNTMDPLVVNNFQELTTKVKSLTDTSSVDIFNIVEGTYKETGESVYAVVYRFKKCFTYGFPMELKGNKPIMWIDVDLEQFESKKNEFTGRMTPEDTRLTWKLSGNDELKDLVLKMPFFSCYTFEPIGDPDSSKGYQLAVKVGLTTTKIIPNGSVYPSSVTITYCEHPYTFPIVYSGGSYCTW